MRFCGEAERSGRRSADPTTPIRRKRSLGTRRRAWVRQSLRGCGLVVMFVPSPEGGTRCRLRVRWIPLAVVAHRHRFPGTSQVDRRAAQGRRYPPDPPRTEEIIAVMRCCDGLHGARARGLIVVLWRAGLRIQEALDLSELDLGSRQGRCSCAAARAAAAARSASTTGASNNSRDVKRLRDRFGTGMLECCVAVDRYPDDFAAQFGDLYRRVVRRLAEQATVPFGDPWYREFLALGPADCRRSPATGRSDPTACAIVSRCRARECGFVEFRHFGGPTVRRAQRAQSHLPGDTSPTGSSCDRVSSRARARCESGCCAASFTSATSPRTRSSSRVLQELYGRYEGAEPGAWHGRDAMLRHVGEGLVARSSFLLQVRQHRRSDVR